MKPQHLIKILVVALAIHTMATISAVAQEADAATVVSRMRVHFQSITSAHVSARLTRRYFHTAAEVSRIRSDQSKTYDLILRGDRVDEVELWNAGGLFRTDSGTHYSSSPEFEMRQKTYDGTKYWSYDKNERYMTSTTHRASDTLPYGVVHPLISAYDFAWYNDNASPTLASLQSSDSWDLVAACTRVVGSDNIDGKECVVLEVRMPSQVVQDEQVYHLVYAAANLDYFPVKVDTFKGTGYLFRTTHASDIRPIPAAESGTVFIAGKIEIATMDWYGSGRTVSQRIHEIDFDKLELNAQIPVDFFTLSPSVALVYNDQEQPWRNFNLTLERAKRMPLLEDDVSGDPAGPAHEPSPANPVNADGRPHSDENRPSKSESSIGSLLRYSAVGLLFLTAAVFTLRIRRTAKKNGDR